jgi:endoglucanase
MPLDTIKLKAPDSYRLFIEDHGNPGKAITPVQVHYKSKPHGRSNVGPGYGAILGLQHQIYLCYNKELPVGRKVKLDLVDLGLDQKSVTVVLDDMHLRTEALQVNQAGYHPMQNVKYGFLSTWMGTGGAVVYDQVKSFEVIKDGSGKVVFTGTPIRISQPNVPDYTTADNGPVYLSRTYVYLLDFSSLNEEGMYRIHIPGIGVSFSFPITPDIWDESAKLQMMGFYHQRSGMSLGHPASDFERPRNFHPEDFPIHDVDRSIYFNKDLYSESEWNQGNPFTRLQKSMLFDTNLPEAYGGWADAADYDRRVPHLRAVMAMLFLYELDPDYFISWPLSLPVEESDNNIPDILDEALWCSELFRRTQLENGEVIEGIESIEHPNRGETSWLNSLPTSIKPGTPSVAYQYAAVAARMSKVLQSFDSDLSEQYAESALKAMSWADANLENDFYEDFLPNAYDMMGAGVYLFLLTEDPAWHDLFIKGWNLYSTSSNRGLNRYNPYPILSYALMSSENADPHIQDELRKGIVAYAKDLMEGMEENTSFLLRPKDQRINFSIVEQLGSEYLIGAHVITGDDQFLNGLLQCSHFSMGANPLNLCYTTGMGHRFIEPFYLDYEYSGFPIPAGIPAYGPVRLDNPLPPDFVWGWHQRRANGYAPLLHPSDIRDWPLVELYFRYVGYPAMNEYTIQQGMREQLTRWAYLARHYSRLE